MRPVTSAAVNGKGHPAWPRGFRVETAGPLLSRRGRYYGVGYAACVGDGTRRPVEKRYQDWAVGAVDSGVFSYRAGRGQLLAIPGAILFGNAGEAFTCQNSGVRTNRRFVVTFSEPLMAEAGEALDLNEASFKTAALPPGPQSMHLYGAVRRLALSEHILDDLALEVVTAGLQIGRGFRRWSRSRIEAARVARVVKYLEATFAESHRLDDMAEVARLSRYHFIRVFRQVTGTSPRQFLIGLRLRAASERLQTSTEPVTSLALAVGFNDISHFNRTFRRAFGMSPRQWRERG